MATDPSRRLTVGVATRNRPDSLLKCLRSLALIDDLVSEIIVVDDSSDPPARLVLDRVPPSIAGRIQFVEQPGNRGYIVARNTMVRLAAEEIVLLLDDDAYVIDAAAVGRGIDAIAGRPGCAAVAFAQAEPDGSPWPVAMQPSRATEPSVVAAFIGFAHLVRRTVFQQLGGYRESFHFYGEEKDYCMRLLDAGLEVVYLPDARVAHVPDRAGRNGARYLRYVVRNDCLCALFNEPLPMACATVPVRLRRYATMRRQGGVDDPGGLGWIVRELVRATPAIARGRTPLRWTSIRRWRSLSRHPRAIAPPAARSELLTA